MNWLLYVRNVVWNWQVKVIVPTIGNVGEHNKLFEGERPKGFRLCVEDYANEVEKNIPIPVDENGYLDPLKTSLNGGTYHFNADRDYLSPIPTDEILKNPNLTQNPGWDTPKM